MSLAAAFATGRLAARATDRRFGPGRDHREAERRELEVREAELRVLARRSPVAPPVAARRDYTERGRHAAPRPARA
ncbi:hypothetical protein [Agromyces subbeticus]|uniref:hypothetical protein n=1 Tax=Agromyces subbeticus TaxID=293890 RepID=UPI0003FE23BE|nr:hypothetical protein [Agromyces subbeticus]